MTRELANTIADLYFLVESEQTGYFEGGEIPQREALGFPDPGTLSARVL